MAGGLTPAQTRVMALVAEGLTNAEIADRLGKAPGTVKRQVAESLHRLRARSRADAAVKFVQSLQPGQRQLTEDPRPPPFWPERDIDSPPMLPYRGSLG
jgi:DNA-binding CsgD family transcriptional regulator